MKVRREVQKLYNGQADTVNSSVILTTKKNKLLYTCMQQTYYLADASEKWKTIFIAKIIIFLKHE